MPVSTMGALVRKLRKQSGKTQAQFADALGVKQSTVSMYERGSAVPGDAVMLHLAAMTTLSEEKEVIVSAMKKRPESEDQPPVLESAEFGAVQDELNNMKKWVGGKDDNRYDLLKLTLKMVRSDDYVPDWILELIGLWRQNQDLHEIWPVFKALPKTVKSELAWIERTGQYPFLAKKDQREVTEEERLRIQFALEILRGPKGHLLASLIDTLSEDLKASPDVRKFTESKG